MSQHGGVTALFKSNRIDPDALVIEFDVIVASLDDFGRGQSIAQTFAQAETRNADLALVALSQAIAYGDPTAYFLVPEQLHAPLRQDAVLLAHGQENAAAREFLKFLRSAMAIKMMADFGYQQGAP